MQVFKIERLTENEELVFESKINEFICFIYKEFNVSIPKIPDNLEIHLTTRQLEGTAMAFFNEKPFIWVSENFDFQYPIRTALFYHELIHLFFSDLVNSSNYIKLDELIAVFVQDLFLGGELNGLNGVYEEVLLKGRNLGINFIVQVMNKSINDNLKLGAFTDADFKNCGVSDEDAIFLLESM